MACLISRIITRLWATSNCRTPLKSDFGIIPFYAIEKYEKTLFNVGSLLWSDGLPSRLR